MPVPPLAAVVFVNAAGVAPEVIDWSLPMAPAFIAAATFTVTALRTLSESPDPDTET